MLRWLSSFWVLSREAQLFVGWISALRNIIGRWVSCFNPTYVLSSFWDIISRDKLPYSCSGQPTKDCLLRNSMTLVMTGGKGGKMVDRQ